MTLYEKLKHIRTDNPLCTYTKERCAQLAPLIEEINELKKQKNALILAHSYVSPEIIYGVADHCGDSYGLALRAKQTKGDIILFAAVRFMAETAKILNPTKQVIDPNPYGGCTLAESIDEKKVHSLRMQYPNHTFVCYINTTAAVKAACDVCVTSANATTVIEKIPNDKIFFLPDNLMGKNLQNHLLKRQISKELLYSDGTCYIHKEFDPAQISPLKDRHPHLKVIAHPECTPEVIAHSDHVCSTTGMIDYVTSQPPSTPFLLLTECGVTSRLQAEHPQYTFVGTCSMCRYMRSNTLTQILQALKNPTPSQVIQIPEEIEGEALKTLEAMFFYEKQTGKEDRRGYSTKC